MLSGNFFVPFIKVDVTWDTAMDDGVLPPVGTFEVVKDGTPETPSSLNWVSNTVLEMFVTAGDVTTLVVNQLSAHANLRDSNGILSVAPQSLQVKP